MTPDSAFCSQCGAALEGDERFCSGCGAAVGEAVPASSAPAPPPAPTPAATPVAARSRMSGPMIGGVVAVVAAVAIGGTILFMGGDDDTPVSTAGTSGTVTVTEAPGSTDAPVTSEPESGAITSLEDAREAVVRIETTGSFVSPEGTQFMQAGGGSGFIISEDGLAVTNNHVVTGAATLQVYLEGEDRARNAYVVAASECSDLAVIDIDGDGYPFFEWYDGAPSTGMAVFAAGFPLGDPEYTLLEGIVSKEDAGGESSWASVDAVIEHTADTLGGNSGGPLVTEDGLVVGINYAGNQLGQSFAISSELARPIVDRLIGGEWVDSVGVNGEAIVIDDSTYGIWVHSIDAGSAADLAGVQPGDLIWTLAEADIGFDGTMSTYCDVLRSHAPGSTLGIQVLRPSTGELLAGQLNGRELEVLFTNPADTGTSEEVGYMEYYDDSGYMFLEVPTTWTDVLETTFDVYGDETNVGPRVLLAPDVDELAAGTGPGVIMLAVWQLDFTTDAYLDAQDESDVCVYDGRHEFYDGYYYEGWYDLWTDCDGRGGIIYQIASYPPDESYMVGLKLVAYTDADFEAMAQVIKTFEVNEDA